jgi:hypothetical protein
MAAAVEAGEATAAELAYLTDRVLLAEGQPQVYGTQMLRKEGHYVPKKLGDPEGVDQRRAAAGLEPVAEYQRRFDQELGPGSLLKCPGCGRWVPFERPGGSEAFTITCAACGHEATIRPFR